jgi:cytoskeleton protein RodZ
MSEPVGPEAAELPAEPEPGETSADRPAPGALLGAERRRQGLSLGDIARQLKLSVRQIEALERDDYEVFAGMVFVRGFLRNYAKLLQLDADVLLAQLPGAAPAEEPSAEPAAAGIVVAGPRRGGRPGMGLLAGAAVLVVLVLAAIYEGRQHETRTGPPLGFPPQTGVAVPQHPDSPPARLTPDAPPAGSGTLAQSATDAAPAAGAAPATPAAPVASPAPAPLPAEAPAAPAPPPAATAAPAPKPPSPATALQPSAAVPAVPAASSGSGQLRLKFQSEAWVEVKDASGAVIFSQLSSAGSEQVVQGRAPLQLVVGNAHAVQVTYQGRMVDLAPHTRVDVARLVLE